MPVRALFGGGSVAAGKTDLSAYPLHSSNTLVSNDSYSRNPYDCTDGKAQPGACLWSETILSKEIYTNSNFFFLNNDYYF